MNEMIVQHHVRCLEALQSANSDQPGITGSGADQIDGRAPSRLDPFHGSSRTIGLGKNVARAVGEQLRADAARRWPPHRPVFPCPVLAIARLPSSDTTTATSSSSSARER